MKKIVLFISLVVLSVISYGQEVVQAQQVQSCIVRNGDRYTVDGMTYINSSEFRGYLKNTNPEVFAQYDKGFRIGMAGWGLLAYGTAMMPTSFILSLFHHDTPDVDPITGKEDYFLSPSLHLEPVFRCWVSAITRCTNLWMCIMFRK